MNKFKILILGAAGMLGHTLFKEFFKDKNFDIWATIRKKEQIIKYFDSDHLKKIKDNIEADKFETVENIIKELKPDVVINCIGIIKQLPSAEDPVTAITINSLFPHKVTEVCKRIGSRFIHISTDCVFDGLKGNYTEKDDSTAKDLYGKTKFLGEINYPHTITIRTSIIGHELKGFVSLVDWFLQQNGKVRGFTNAIYTGFPTIELARIISEVVIPNENLSGLYHVSANKINKYDLLRTIASIYNKKIDIEPYNDFYCDRSLDSSNFRNTTGYIPPEWNKLVEKMYEDYIN